MTAQSSDQVRYRGKSYSIAGKNGKGLFDPTQHGMKPVGKCSFCRRGIVCTYSVDGQRLLLDQLAIYLNEPAPVLFDVQPKPPKRGVRSVDALYEDLKHPIPYTGGLLLAHDFIRELYVHMGFHPAWKYREVHELIFHEGELVQQTDRSEQIAELRQEIANRPLEPEYEARRSEIERWVEKCFSQEYRW